MIESLGEVATLKAFAEAIAPKCAELRVARTWTTICGNVAVEICRRSRGLKAIVRDGDRLAAVTCDGATDRRYRARRRHRETSRSCARTLTGASVGRTSAARSGARPPGSSRRGSPHAAGPRMS